MRNEFMKKKFLASCLFAAGLVLSSCGGTGDKSNDNPPPERKFFDQINEKMDLVSRTLGKLCSDGSQSRSTRRVSFDDPDNYPFYEYGEGKVESFVNVQQQLDYIVTIVGYIEEHLSSGDYGVEFAYDTVFEGEAYMKTISTLNDVLINNDLPTPKLKAKFSKEGNNLIVKTSWDYRNNFMEQYSPFWSLDILSSLKFVFDDSKEIKQIWVNYNFADSVNFNCAVGLFDFENAYYESILYHNTNTNEVRYKENEKERCLQNVQLFNSGNMTHNNLIRCSDINVSRTKLGDNVTLNDFDQKFFYVNGHPIEDDISEFLDYSKEPTCKGNFETFYDEVYSHLSSFKFETSYQSSEVVNVTPLYVDASVYSFWKAVFIYDTRINETIIPFIGYSDLLGIMDTVIAQLDGDNKSQIEALRAAIALTENKYTGNEYKVGDDFYEIWLDENARVFYEGNGNLISYYCTQDFHYVLKKNGVQLFVFDASGIVA